MIAPDELIIDNFAGGGGASTGIEQALGRAVDIAINHDPEALAMHKTNHPGTLHLCEDVWSVDPVKVVAGRRVGLAWFSPDCKHFSKAKGGKPVEKRIRGLAWVALRWAHVLVAAFLAQHNAGPHNGNLSGRSATIPLSTITVTGTQQQIVTAFLSRQFGRSVGHAADEPTGTTTSGGGGKSALVASSLVKLRGTNTGQPVDEPLQALSAQGTHFGEVRAFLMKYYGTDQDPQLTEPLHSITTKDRFAVVMVQGEPCVITDIGMRMLTPRELFRAQGFPEDYVIDRGVAVAPRGGAGNLFDVPVMLTKTAQVRMVGNSVSPHPAAALVAAQFGVAMGEECVA